VRESIAMIKAAGGTPHAVAIALDRQEKAAENGVEVPWSAVQYVQNELGLRVAAIATLTDLLVYLKSNADPALGAHYARVIDLPRTLRSVMTKRGFTATIAAPLASTRR